MQRKKKTREKHGSFGNKGTACGWSTENAKIIIKNKLHIFLPSLDPTAEFLHLYWHVNHKGAPKTRYLVCGPYAIPKVLTLFLRIAQNHLGQLPSLSHTLLPTEQQRQNMSDQVPSYYHRTTDATCLTLPFGLEIKNSCADACGSAVSSFR